MSKELVKDRVIKYLIEDLLVPQMLSWQNLKKVQKEF